MVMGSDAKSNLLHTSCICGNLYLYIRSFRAAFRKHNIFIPTSTNNAVHLSIMSVKGRWRVEILPREARPQRMVQRLHIAGPLGTPKYPRYMSSLKDFVSCRNRGGLTGGCLLLESHCSGMEISNVPVSAPMNYAACIPP